MNTRRRRRSSRFRHRLGEPRTWQVGGIIALVIATAGVAVVALNRDYVDPGLADARPMVAATSTVALPVAPPVSLNVQVARPVDRPLRVLFTGDSLTYGLYASEQDKGYRGVLVAELAKQGPIEPAASTRSGAGAGVVASITDVPADLDLAIIELGTNDVGGQTPIPDFTATYAALLDKIRGKTPNVPLLCIGTWGSDGGGYGSDPYNKAITTECEKRGGQFVTMYDLYPNEAFRGPAGLEKFGGVSDDFHPNDAGYQAIADTLLKRITIT